MNGARKKESTTAVELFCGIGGFRIAAERHGIRTLWANDLAPLACKVYRSRFGAEELREGEIVRLKANIPRGFALLTAGFPCQPFSNAGKKMGVRDPRGTLFQVIVDILRDHEPESFLLENVKRLLTMEKGFHFATILAALSELNYELEWRLINAMHFGLPQNRQRIVIIGRRRPSARTHPKIRLLSSEDATDLSDDEVETLLHPRHWARIEEHGDSFPCWGLAEDGRFFGASVNKFSEEMPPVRLRDVLEADVQPEFDFTESTLPRIRNSASVNRFIQGVQTFFNQGGGLRMGYTIFGVDGVAPTLTSSASRHYERYRIGNRYRRLTNVEYARIQGFPDDHCSAASVYDQYALYGNAVPPPMAQWAIGKLLDLSQSIPVLPQPRQTSLFSLAHA